jgi:hypothetical protein
MISIDALMGKVRQFANSPAGKKRMKACIDDMRESGGTLASGQKIVGTKEMNEAAMLLINIIRRYLPDSIKDLGSTLTNNQPVKLNNNDYEVTVGFNKTALRRKSLYEDGYPDGVENIVALLNNGYNASKHVYGIWDNHSPTGGALFDTRNTMFGDTSAYIKSLKDREALKFMQVAITEFNDTYGQQYNVTATLGSVYTEKD